MLKKIILSDRIGRPAAVGLLAGLEPLNGPSSGSFPASEEEAMAGLYAAYKGLANMTVKGPLPHADQRLHQRHRHLPYGCGQSDQGDELDADGRQHDVREGIQDGLQNRRPRASGAGQSGQTAGASSPKIGSTRSKAELLCIRAYYYDLGCQFYGDIPFIDHQLDLDDYSDYPRIPREQVTARLLQDLDDDLLDYLPVQWNPGTYGRRASAVWPPTPLKARIALNWGCGRRPHAVRRSPRRSPRASTISNRSTAPTTLPTPTANLRRRTYSGFAGQTSREWLWAIQYNRLINYTSATYYEAPRIHGGCSWLGPSQAMVDTFQCTDGKPITESPLYDWQNPWANRDPRLDLFCLRPDTRLWGVQYDTDVRVEKGEGLQSVDGGQRGAHQQRRRRGQQERVCGQRQQRGPAVICGASTPTRG